MADVGGWRLLACGAATEEAGVEDGEIHAGNVMRIHATLDHRILEGKHAALLSKIIGETLEDPFALFDEIPAIPENFAEAAQ